MLELDDQCESQYTYVATLCKSNESCVVEKQVHKPHN